MLEGFRVRLPALLQLGALYLAVLFVALAATALLDDGRLLRAMLGIERLRRETLFEPNQRPTMRKLITSMLAGDVFHEGRRPQWASLLRQHYPPEVPAFA